MHKGRIFVDLDGTVYEWGDCKNQEYMEKGYYKSLPEISNMVDAVKEFLKQGYEVFILTAYPTKHAIHDKNFNLDSTFGKEMLPLSHRIFVPYGDNKANYIMQFEGDKNILIDDYNPNLECWNGIAIKFLNGVNGGSNEWQGHKISRNMTGREIVQEVQRISDMYVPIQIEKEKTISSYQQKIMDNINKAPKTTNKNIDRD